MKRISFISFIFCTGLLLQTESSRSYGQLYIGVTGGTATRWAVPKSLDALGLGVNVSARYRVWKGLMAGANFSYYAFGPEEKSTANVDYKISYVSYTGSVEYHLLKNRFKPYIGLDLGMFNYHTVTTIDFGSSGNQDFVKNEYYFGFAPVIGANYALTERLLLNANIKLNTVIIQEAAPIGYASLSVGIFYTFFK